jgi:nucleoside-triphosphatase THEP1
VPSVRLLTGAVDSGKTAWLQRRAALPGRAGFLSCKRFSGSGQDSAFLGYDLLFLPSGDSMPLARLAAHGDAGEGWFLFRRFMFDPRAFAAAESRQCEQATAGTEEFLLDEIGPLEMEGRGFAGLLGMLLTGERDLIISTRPSLIRDVQERFAFSAAEILGPHQDPSRIFR